MNSIKYYQDQELIVSGRIRKPFGVRGQLSVDWNNGKCPVRVGEGFIYLETKEDKVLKKFTILKDHRHGDHDVITLKGVTGRSEAEKFYGSDIWIDKDVLSELEEGEYYTYQLLGMRVESLDGEFLGTIDNIFATGSNDVYVVKKGDEELLVPAIEDVVKSIDISAKLMKIELIEGLR